MIDWKRVCLWGVLAGAAPSSARAAATSDEARSSAPLVTVTTDDSIEIRVQGLIPDGEEVEWKWGKLVVPIETTATPEAGFAESYNDETVKRVALVGGEAPRLLVMFRHGAKTAKLLTEASTVTHTGDGFRVTIPRKHALTDEKTPLTAVAEGEPAAPEVGTDPAPTPKAVEVAPAMPEGVAVAAAATVEEPAPRGEALNLPEPDAAPLPTMAPANPSMYGTVGFTLVLLAIGGAFVWWKRRTGATPGAPKGFTVMGNQVLGPKSRIVLMGLGDRRMLIAVSEAGTTVVDKWTEGEGYVPSTSARASGGFDEQTLAAIEFGGPVEPLEPRIKTQRAATIRAYQAPPPDEQLDDDNAESTAVRGLLALRKQMEDNEDEAEEDDAWSRALASRMRSA